MNDLEMYREQLALCDDKIIDALVERNSIIEKIMAYKEEYGMPILQPQQEEKQKKRLEEKLSDNRYKEEIFDVFGCILRNSKRIQARKLFDYNIVLIGFMGAGKTTISDYLSTMFDMDIVEMDQVIAEREEMSISDIFATYGEEYFRDLETNLLIEMQSHKNAVISCGGGAALRERNVAEMKKNGRVVLLTATPETIYERVKDSNDRPVLNGRKNVKGISELMEQRREKYEAAADLATNFFLCAHTPTQHAALACFTPETLAVCEERRQELLERRRIVVDGLAEIGLPLEVEPNGAFYAYFNISGTGLDAWTFCERALKEAHIALTPGRDFGEATADTHVRLSYAASREALREGLNRLGDFVAKVRG